MTRKAQNTVPADVMDLLSMLQYKRPSGGGTEQAFIKRFLLPLGAKPDDYGNLWLQVGDSPILWSCHTDSVHRTEGKQRILYGAGVASVEKGECLGADCATGIWLMSQMIQARKPGLYVFHADEEIGGLGSGHIAAKHQDWLEGVKFAIAFDRKGQDEIITHQAGERCASDAFAASLAACLAPLKYRHSDGGTFTDTANYTRIVPECTNISVGYEKQHTGGEIQDVRHALRLRDAILAADFTTLVCERDPAVIEEKPYRWKTPKSYWNFDPWADSRDPDGRYEKDALASYVENNAEDVADFLRALGYDQDDLENFIMSGLDSYQ